MGKTYIDTVKYIVYADVEINGLVEKPDVVGAIFGQTEGLLGDELDLRDLQKNGRIGRIEVDLVSKSGKTTGKLKLPSSLDMVETSILAAALETVDRVGPCDAHLKVEKVEDTRNVKRKVLIDRAKQILKRLLSTEIPESKEISDVVRKEVKVAEISSFGEDKLPCGPNIQKYDSIVVVEGRADVINLLKNDIPNVIAIGGANITPTIVKLCREKEVTVFLDGDRGGDIILNELSSEAEVDFVARAPDGKEVEELTRKEIIKCMRSKIPFNQYMAFKSEQNHRKKSYQHQQQRFQNYQKSQKKNQNRNNQQSNQKEEQTTQRQRGIAINLIRGRKVVTRKISSTSAAQVSAKTKLIDNSNQNQKQTSDPSQKPEIQKQQKTNTDLKKDQAKPKEQAPKKQEKEPKQEKIDLPTTLDKRIADLLDELENTMRAKLFDKELNIIKEIAVRDIIKSMNSVKNIYGIVFDGFITQQLADTASRKNVRLLVGLKMGNVKTKPNNVAIFTKESTNTKK